MPKKKLTAAFVERVKPPAKDELTYFDQGFPGLALRVFYGGGKSWSFFYRIQGGSLRRTKLGTYPAMTLLQARDAWREARQNVAKGIDPSPRRGVRRAETFREIVAEWMRRDQSKNRASTIYQTDRLFQVDLLPAWGSRRIDTITSRDIIELLDKIGDRAPTQAGRVFAHLHRLFGWCVRRGVLMANPIATVDKPGKYASREKVLSETEIVAVWSACSEAPYGTAARLLMLTGGRLQEIARLRESEIVGDVIELSGERTKGGRPHTIPLSSAARALLKSVPRGSSGEFLFSNDGGQNPVTAWGHAKGKIDAVAKIDPWRLHDLRRTLATGLQRLGVNLQVIEAVLGHVGTRAGIVGVYQRHGFKSEARAALEAWGAHVMALVEGREPGKVLPFGGKR